MRRQTQRTCKGRASYRGLLLFFECLGKLLDPNRASEGHVLVWRFGGRGKSYDMCWCVVVRDRSCRSYRDRPRHASPHSQIPFKTTQKHLLSLPYILPTLSWITTPLSSLWVCASLSVHRLFHPPGRRDHQGPPFSPNSASLRFQQRLSRNLQRCIRVGKVASIPTTTHLPSSPTHSETRQQPRLPITSSLLFSLSNSPRMVLQSHDTRANFYLLST